jgi:hypothetical protein
MKNIHIGLLLFTIGILTLILLTDYYVYNSFNSLNKDIPIVELSKEIDAVKQSINTTQINNYKELCNALINQKKELFDLVVVKSLQPIFNLLIAAVLTYIFGKIGATQIRAYLEKRLELKYNALNKK